MRSKKPPSIDGGFLFLKNLTCYFGNVGIYSKLDIQKNKIGESL